MYIIYAVQIAFQLSLTMSCIVLPSTDYPQTYIFSPLENILMEDERKYL